MTPEVYSLLQNDPSRRQIAFEKKNQRKKKRNWWLLPIFLLLPQRFQFCEHKSNPTK